MMYDGITTDAIFLLSQNRFENSKEFYEANKAKINDGIVMPMRQIVSALAEDMAKIDEKFTILPNRAVSRVRRDTRFTKDKSLYRDHMWLSFERSKQEFQNYPGFWFEVTPEGYGYGMGYFAPTPAFMDFQRGILLAKEKEFLKAAAKALKTGAELAGEEYKRKKPGDYSEAISPYCNRKDIYFPKTVAGHENLADERILAELRGNYREMADVYRFFVGVADEFAAKV